MTKQNPVVTFRSTVASKALPADVYDVLADPSTHLQWAGAEAPMDNYKLLTLDAPSGRASAGTVFTSTGASSKDGSSTFHDTSTVTEAADGVFAFETVARLTRKHRPTWNVRFVHRYVVTADGDGSCIDYTCDVHPINYRPYWLHPIARPLLKQVVNRTNTKHMGNLARMAERSSPLKER